MQRSNSQPIHSYLKFLWRTSAELHSQVAWRWAAPRRWAAVTGQGRRTIELRTQVTGLTEVARETDIQNIHDGFADWVEEFERLYYRHAPNRLRVCTLPIHSLLRIADDTIAMGPVWCYWAFLMERLCGAVGCANLNPHFPFISMDRRVLEVAQVAQIKYTYNLFETFDLGDPKQATARGTCYPAYLHSIFVQPRRVITIDASLAKHLGAYISNMCNVDSKPIEQRIKGNEFDMWGKMQQTTDSDGLDMISGHGFMPDTGTARRDTTFIKYISRWDRSVHGRPKHDAEGAFAFGRVKYFLVLDAQVIAEITGADDSDERDAIDDKEGSAKTFAVAVISPILSFKRLKDCNLITYELPGGRLGAIELVEVEDVVCLVGCVQDHAGNWFIVDRTSVVGKIDFADSLADPN